MTGPVIHTLDESTGHVFDTMPDPLRTRDASRSARHRPDWMRVALRDEIRRRVSLSSPDGPVPEFLLHRGGPGLVPVE
ncbi:hypothetical protein ACFY1J_27440 [Streptomyces sp. NPDC001406]|uniref:hypothetical protein n=1 Tax=Streptomyces sp. NPDC001406 TaxID=3364572 RepID=UPI00369BD2C8